MGRRKKYNTEEERIAARRERKKRYYEATREHEKERKRKYYIEKRDKLKGYSTEYRKSKHGRANAMVRDYGRADKDAGRGECTLTGEWIEENIFTSVCHYCGETDWHKLGCDRKDSSLPHTPENCVPCCKHCNDKKNKTPYEEFMRMIGKIKEVA